jgi:two-component system, response regulator PdtaR
MEAMAQTRPYGAVSVLVVEDELLIRMAALDFVEEAGFAVFEACGADEAIRILELHPEIRIVFTDINMPGSMDGLKLAHYIRRRWPPVQLIVTSGEMKPSAEDMPIGSVFLAKPYGPNLLRDQLRTIAANLTHSRGDHGNRL